MLLNLKAFANSGGKHRRDHTQIQDIVILPMEGKCTKCGRHVGVCLGEEVAALDSFSKKYEFAMETRG